MNMNCVYQQSSQSDIQFSPTYPSTPNNYFLQKSKTHKFTMNKSQLNRHSSNSYPNSQYIYQQQSHSMKEFKIKAQKLKENAPCVDSI